MEGAAAVESLFLWIVRPDCPTDRRYYARDCVTTLAEGEAICFGPLGHETWEVQPSHFAKMHWVGEEGRERLQFALLVLGVEYLQKMNVRRWSKD